MIESLRQNGVTVIECHEPLWLGIEDRIQVASGKWFRFGFIKRLIITYWKLLVKYSKIGPYDIMVLGYPGQFDVFLARLLTWLKRKPLVWDVFMSIYLISLERGLDKKSKFTIDTLRKIEKISCHLPNLLILDTTQYVQWFNTIHNISTRRFGLVPTGADDRYFLPNNPEAINENTIVNVVYYGTFIQNHGVPFILEAAKLIDDENIKFELIGDGPEKAYCHELCNKYNLQNVSFINWMNKKDLIKYLSKADIILGAFGSTPQSLMTVQNKIYEGLAMGKMVISGDSKTIREHLQADQEIVLVDRNNPADLAKKITYFAMSKNARNQIAQNGYKRFINSYSIQKNGANFKKLLEGLIK